MSSIILAILTNISFTNIPYIFAIHIYKWKHVAGLETHQNLCVRTHTLRCQESWGHTLSVRSESWQKLFFGLQTGKRVVELPFKKLHGNWVEFIRWQLVFSCPESRLTANNSWQTTNPERLNVCNFPNCIVISRLQVRQNDMCELHKA